MATTPKVQNNLLTSATTLASQVGAFTPLAQISSVVQSLQNLQGFNPGQFAQISGSIQSALQGFSEASSILSNFAGNSPIGAITSALNSTGLAGSSIAGIAQAGASAYQAADSFLNSVQQADSFSRLSSRRVSVEATREQNKISNYQFPLDIGKYWISLEFVKVGFATTWGAGPVTEASKGGVILPVPTNLQDSDSLEYSAVPLTDKMGSAATNGLSAIFGGKMNAVDQSKVDRISSAVSAVRDIAEAGGTITGVAVNTNQILKFNQPTLKSHTFSWRLVPSTPQEAKAIHNIIQYVKSRIYPAANMAVFKYPDLVKVALYNSDQMYLFRPAYVRGFSVTYNPDGQAFHRDRYPLAVQIDMQIQENSVWTSGDFQGGSSYGLEDVASDLGGQALDVGRAVGRAVFGGAR
jgi:hypothetical protein